MTNWMISLDESGMFDEDKQYFIIAGILYRFDDFKSVRDYFVPLVNKLCKVINEDELHARTMGGNKRKFCRTVLFSHIGNFERVKPIVYIIDKKNTKIIKHYRKKSWKYNKILEFLYLDLIDNEIILRGDKLAILIDNLELSQDEEKNLSTWLPSQYKTIMSVEKGDSKDFKFIQMADMIANSFSRDEKCQTNSYDIKILNPFIEVFPKHFRDDYIE